VYNTLMKKILLLVLIIAVSGCASVISKPVMDKVDKSVTAEELFKDPQKYYGKTIVIGGVIIETENLETKTRVEVLESPLSSSLKPEKELEKSRGRFFAYIEGFSDPALWAPGRFITIAGPVSGVETNTIDKHLYAYPVISVEEYHLWKPYSGPSLSIGVGVGTSF